MASRPEIGREISEARHFKPQSRNPGGPRSIARDRASSRRLLFVKPLQRFRSPGPCQPDSRLFRNELPPAQEVISCFSTDGKSMVDFAFSRNHAFEAPPGGCQLSRAHLIAEAPPKGDHLPQIGFPRTVQKQHVLNAIAAGGEDGISVVRYSKSNCSLGERLVRGIAVWLFTFPFPFDETDEVWNSREIALVRLAGLEPGEVRKSERGIGSMGSVQRGQFSSVEAANGPRPLSRSRPSAPCTARDSLSP